MFVAPQGGMTDLVTAIAAQLPAKTVQRQQPVAHISRAAAGWNVQTAGSLPAQMFDGVIVATPAFRAADLLEGNHRTLAELLRTIPYASAAVAAIVYRREQISHPLNGFGFVVPQRERRQILAASFSHVKFADRAPSDLALIRVFLGGALQPHLLERDDRALQAIACDELADLIGARGDPVACRTARWQRAMPQYHVGHLTLVDNIERQVAGLACLEIAGNAYRGVGIPFCIQSGEQAAIRLAASLQQTTSL